MPHTARERIEEELLEAMHTARRRYEARECSLDQYRDALKDFNGFILYGQLPADLKVIGRPAASHGRMRLSWRKRA